MSEQFSKKALSRGPHPCSAPEGPFSPASTRLNVAEISTDDGGWAREAEADRIAREVMGLLYNSGSSEPGRTAGEEHDSTLGVSGLGSGRPLSSELRGRFEGAFGWDFSSVRLHAGPTAASAATRLGARAFTLGRDVVFSSKVANPEAGEHRELLAHELAHVVQQDMGAGSRPSPRLSSVSAAQPTRAQGAPAVTNVATSAAELGVGGRDITATATVAGHPALTWTINPGAVVPAGVSVIGGGRTVRIRAAQPGGAIVTGDVPITIRAALTATPGDNFDAHVNLIQVVSAAYAANPALAAVPSLIPGAPPPNTAEPNRDGIAGNTATVNIVTAPAGRPVTIAFRRSLGAALAGNVITPGTRTGDVGLRITDNATQARLNETRPSTAGPAALMADMTINAVPTRVRAVNRTGTLGPYGQLDPIIFAPSDNLHPPLTRIVGELITLVRDDFNVGPINPPIGFNNAFVLGLAVPANTWNDQLVTPAGILNVADARQAIDINRFAGPGVPHQPRRWILRQRFQYASWRGAGAVVSRTIDDGQHIRSLVGTPAAPLFRTEHRFGGVAAPSPTEAYVGNPLINLTNVAVAPTAPGATGLAADGAATANLTVVSNVGGRTVNWTVLDGDAAIIAGNPAVLPAAATLRAGVRVGNFRMRAADSIFPNRRVDGRVRIVPVRLHAIRAVPARVAAGGLTSNISITADPGGRRLNWTVDPAATVAGVVVAPAAIGPGLAMNVTVTRPAAFKGTVTVTATDTVLAARRETVSVRFL